MADKTYVHRTEWEGERTRLVSISGVRRSNSFPRGDATTDVYRKLHSRRVSEIYVHQTAGNFYDGVEAVSQLADYFAAPPRYRVGPDGSIERDSKGKPRKVGGGKGWPGIPYTFVIPSRPDAIDGRFVVYRVWDDEWRTWHTQAGHANEHGVAIAVVGYYKTRHDPDGPGRDAPDETAMVALEELVRAYLLPRYELGVDAIKGHFDAGKPACPGDHLEAWVRRERGEAIAGDVGGSPRFRGPLKGARARQTALATLGYDVGAIDGIWGPRSRAALEALQDEHGLLVDGIWGPRTESIVRSILPAD